jgi:hypothetical protein
MTDQKTSPESASTMDKGNIGSAASQQTEVEESRNRELAHRDGKIRLVSLLVGIGFAGLAGALVSRYSARRDALMLSYSIALDQDMNIVSTAIPAITNEFHNSLDDGWYGTA